MYVRKAFSDKKFTVTNSLVLSILFLYLWVRSMGTGHPATTVIFWPGAYVLSVWVLSFGIVFVFKNSSFKDQKRFLSHHAAASVLFGLLHFLLTGILILVLERFFRLSEHYTFSDSGDYFRSSWYFISDGVIWYWMYVMVMLLLYLRMKLLQERQDLSTLRKELTASDLNTLSTELNPHFLFNSMNGIAMKVRMGENKLAVTMIAALNDLLRTVLYRRDAKMILLAEELELLNRYLMIEQQRFGDQVKVEIRCPDELKKVLVPQLILQPLVENAFKHGIKENMGQQTLKITAERQDRSLILTVFNTTTPTNWIVTDTGSQGVGLPNVIRRLRGIYGTAFRFQSHYLDNGLSFRITIPWQI